jgi:hypothetical protein
MYRCTGDHGRLPKTDRQRCTNYNIDKLFTESSNLHKTPRVRICAETSSSSRRVSSILHGQVLGRLLTIDISVSCAAGHKWASTLKKTDGTVRANQKDVYYQTYILEQLKTAVQSVLGRTYSFED